MLPSCSAAAAFGPSMPMSGMGASIATADAARLDLIRSSDDTRVSWQDGCVAWPRIFRPLNIASCSLWLNAVFESRNTEEGTVLAFWSMSKLSLQMKRNIFHYLFLVEEAGLLADWSLDAGHRCAPGGCGERFALRWRPDRSGAYVAALEANVALQGHFEEAFAEKDLEKALLSTAIFGCACCW